MQQLTHAEIFNHSKAKDIWLLIHGKVYDVSKFSEDHPGGEEVLISAAGKDATDDFEDVGHSSSAKAMMEEYYIGDADPKSSVAHKSSHRVVTVTPPRNDESPRVLIWIFTYIVPLAIFGVAIAVKSYLDKVQSS
ncbi:hypothetical protein O6H91_04G116600 [Diphasiastrum complanatum]|uniref:Uncharacterized protein n=1 Tax=Diphasiastrum complanatum TaxID=34168 RepID=A0ACC2E116_DIPCM|nr:hypothetical protein O6H91_Y337600 [Diphasiastrum complanatum]KAJ7560157.1 hypothetical protein O6H91_04G116600 [Diphasiastrum complanatum]